MGQDNHRLGNLLLQLVEFLVTFLDLLVQGLIFNLKLLKINQMQTVGQLLTLLVNLVEIVVTVTKRDILQTVLMDLLVLKALMDLPLLDHVFLQLLAGSAEYSILGNGVLKSFELSLDLLALRLLLVELGLQFRGHSVVPVLSLFQIEANLMHVGKCVQVLMLLEHLLGLLLKVSASVIHLEDPALQRVILSFKRFIFFSFVLDCEDQFLLHFGGRGKVTDTTVVLLIIILIVVEVFIVDIGVFMRARLVAAGAVLAGGALGSVG